ncbi:MAG: outer membrane beta-barrel protein [Candidatus Eisenbacteria bacterium]
MTRIGLFAFLSAVLVSLGAPQGARAIIDTGLSVGMNFASLDDVDVKDTKTTYDNKTGWHFGVFAKTALGPLGLRAGAVYLDAGPLFEGLSDNLEGVTLKDDFDVRFFVVPIDLQYRLVTPVVKPYLLAGPEIRFNVTSSDDFEGNFKDTQWAANVGVGIEFTLPIVGVGVTPEFRYSFALTDLTEDSIEIGGVSYDLSDAFKVGSYHLRVHVSF